MMGVDGCIFERKSKMYFSYDRDSQLLAFFDLKMSEEVSERAYDVKNELYQDGAKVSSAGVIFFAQLNIDAYEEGPEDQKYHQENLRGIIKFAEKYPDGEFFIRLDNDDAFDLIGEMHGEKGGIWTGEYMEFVP
jgi:hypothetical protein